MIVTASCMASDCTVGLRRNKRRGQLPLSGTAQSTFAAQLELPDQSVDVVYSRFGVMFFSDPVQAFGNLRRILRPDGRLSFVCWRPISENQLDYLPLKASGLTLSDAPHVSFEQPYRIREILHAAGFSEIAVEPFDAEVSCGGLDRTVEVVTQVGALGKALRD